MRFVESNKRLLHAGGQRSSPRSASQSLQRANSMSNSQISSICQLTADSALDRNCCDKKACILSSMQNSLPVVLHQDNGFALCQKRFSSKCHPCPLLQCDDHPTFLNEAGACDVPSPATLYGSGRETLACDLFSRQDGTKPRLNEDGSRYSRLDLAKPGLNCEHSHKNSEVCTLVIEPSPVALNDCCS